MGKVAINATIEKELRDKIKALAEKENRPFSNMLETLLINSFQCEENEKDMKRVIRSLALSMRAHPDNVEGSEFDTLTEQAKNYFNE
jgi:hypothetical protein